MTNIGEGNDADGGTSGGTSIKNIVLCSDGTGNAGGKKNGTNVWRLYQAVDTSPNPVKGPRQIAFHDDGVGSEDFKLLRIVGGAFGYGLSENIRQLYASLVRTYDPGDQIFLFGFSRGAYTVRSLAGFIHHCGILDRRKYRTATKLEAAITELYAYYRGTNWKAPADKIPEPEINGEVVYRHTGAAVRITFVGVWDTVDAIGVPFDWLRYPLRVFPSFRRHQDDLNSSMEYVYHALAIDDARQTFDPVMFENPPGPNTEVVDQVWFAGVHSNVGGSYPKDQMALVTLDWMMTHAAALGGTHTPLRFIPSFRKQYHDGASVHGKLYDSRAGLAAYYRIRPRHIDKFCKGCTLRIPNVPNPAKIRIHRSVFDRIKYRTAGYAPANIPAGYEAVDTPATAVSASGPSTPVPPVTAGSVTDEVNRLALSFWWWQRGLYLVLLALTAWLLTVLTVSGATDPSEHTAVLFPQLAPFVQFIVPEYLSNWVAAIFRRPDWLLFFAGAYGVLLICRGFLKALKNNLAGMAWRHFYLVQKNPNGKETRKLAAAMQGLKSSQWKAFMWGLGRLGLKYRWPGIVSLLALAAGLYGLIVLDPHEDWQSACRQVHAASQTNGGLQVTGFTTDRPCFRTDIRLAKGDQIRVDVSAIGWRDLNIDAGPDGFPLKKEWGWWPMWAFAPLLRSTEHDYFVLMGQVLERAEDGNGGVRAVGPPFAIGGAGNRVLVPASGTLALFVNDIDCRWCPPTRFKLYENNQGSADLRIAVNP